MGHEFKPGDLALIKQCRTWPEAIGRCVTLVQRFAPGEQSECAGRLFFNESPGFAWVIESEQGFPIHSAFFGLMTDHFCLTALFGEHLLMPLRGDEQPAPVQSEELVHG